MSKKIEDKPYLDAPKTDPAPKNEQMIYGGGVTITEVVTESEEKKKKLLVEG